MAVTGHTAWARRRYSSVVSEIPFAYQGGHNLGNLFRLYIRVDAVLVVEVDTVGLQAAKGTFHRTAYHFGARTRDNGMRTRFVRSGKRDAKLGGYHNVVAEGL